MGVSSLGKIGQLVSTVGQQAVRSKTLSTSIAAAVKQLGCYLPSAAVETPSTFGFNNSLVNAVLPAAIPLAGPSARGFRTFLRPLGFPKVPERIVTIAGPMPEVNEFRALLNKNPMSELNLELASGVSDAHCQVISEFNDLVSLTLPGDSKNGSPISEEGLSLVAKLHNLKKLDVANCRNVTNAVLENFSNLSHLRSLNLVGCTAITDDGMTSVGKLIALSELKMGLQPELTDEGLRSIASLKNLTRLKIGQDSKISGEGFRDWGKNLSQLVELDLYGMPLVDSCMSHLAKLGRLAMIQVGSCGITKRSLLALKESTTLRKFQAQLCPNLNHTDLVLLDQVNAQLLN